MGATAAASSASAGDDVPTVCAVSIVAGIVANIVHEGLGHGLVALLTVAPSGTLSTVAWSSDYESRLVAAGGTLANLAAALVCWLILRRVAAASPSVRLFWVLCFAFNLFTGTGYFFFSGVSNFGDWAVVIEGMQPHAFWRVLLIVVGVLAYWGAVVAVGQALVRYVGVPLQDTRRFFRLTAIPYFTAVVLATLAGLLNPAGVNLVFLSALPATAGGDCGLLWMRWYIPKKTAPLVNPDPISRSWPWLVVSALLALAFIFILGRGIHLHR